MLMMLCMCNTI